MKLIRQLGSLAFVMGLFTVLFAGMPWYVTVVDDPVMPWWFRAAVYSLLGGILIVLLTLALEQRKHRMTSEDFQTSETRSQVLVLNSLEVPGREITEILGLVQGHLIAFRELHAAGEMDMAATHAKHPESEIYAALAPAFAARSKPGFADELSALVAAGEEGGGGLVRTDATR